jgi:hypothetical protein
MREALSSLLPVVLVALLSAPAWAQQSGGISDQVALALLSEMDDGVLGRIVVDECWELTGMAVGENTTCFLIVGIDDWTARVYLDHYVMPELTEARAVDPDWLQVRDFHFRVYAVDSVQREFTLGIQPSPAGAVVSVSVP